jgi:RNA polymerase sigma-70 factor (ECF subfamily)
MVPQIGPSCPEPLGATFSQPMETLALDGYADGLRARDPDAVAACYEALHVPLYRFLVGQCGNRALAEDLVMATFEELLQHGHRIRGGGDAIRAWVFRAARNNLIDERRKTTRRGDVSLSDEDVERHASRDPGTEETALNAVGDRQLQAALAHLSDEQREVLALRFGAGLSGPETAQATGRSLNAVKSLQHRALGTLSKLLGVSS